MSLTDLTQQHVNGLSIVDSFTTDNIYTIPLSQLSTYDTSAIKNRIVSLGATPAWVDSTINGIRLTTPNTTRERSVYQIQITNSAGKISYLIVSSIHDGVNATIDVKIMSCSMSIPTVYTVCHHVGERRWFGIAGPHDKWTTYRPRALNATEIGFITSRLVSHAQQRLLTAF
jgi:hypothetical protein